MIARLVLVSILAVLAACSSDADKQLEAVKSARSVIAEWALVEDQSSNDRAQETYVEQIRKLAKDQLKSDQTSLAGQPDASELLNRLRASSPDAEALKRAGFMLEPLEERFEAP